MALPLPPEILLLIIDILHPPSSPAPNPKGWNKKTDKQTLLSLSLVNRQLAHLTQRAIFAHPQPATPAQQLKLHLALLRYPHLRGLVRHLAPVPNIHRARWLVPALLRLVTRNLRLLPNLRSIAYTPSAAGIFCSPLLGLPAQLEELKIFAFLTPDVLRVLDEQPGLERLSVLDMSPNPEAALIPSALQALLTAPEALPNLKTLVAGPELAIHLLPGRGIRQLSIPASLDADATGTRLACALGKTGRDVEVLHLHTYSFASLEEAMGALKGEGVVGGLRELQLDFIELRNQQTLEQLTSPPGLALLHPLKALTKLWLRFTFRPYLLSEDHAPMLAQLGKTLPGLREVVLCTMLRGESVTYMREDGGDGEAGRGRTGQEEGWGRGERGGAWTRGSVVVNDTAAFYAAHI